MSDEKSTPKKRTSNRQRQDKLSDSNALQVMYKPKKIYGRYVVDGDSLYYIDDLNNPHSKSYVAKLTYIEQILYRIDVEPVEIDLVLRYWYHSSYNRITITRDQLNPSELIKLMKNGLDVQHHNVRRVASFLSIQEDDAPKVNAHMSLGWMEKDGKMLFKHNEILPKGIISSSYEGKFKLQKGTLDGWLEVIDQEVLGHAPLEFAMVAGMAAPIVSLLARDADSEVLVLHAYGDSSQGKTTAARLFVSGFGRPSRKDGGTILSWKATQNSLMGQLADIHGVPLGIDEASANKMADFSEVIYELAEGKLKGRMNKDSSLKAEKTWSGALFSTAEHSLIMKSVQNTGLLVRLQEFGNVTWTKDAANANALKKGLMNHYGVAGPEFVSFTQKVGKEQLQKLVAKQTAILLKEMESVDGPAQRLADRYALILTTALLMNKCFNIKLDVKEIKNFLLQQFDEVNQQGGYALRAYSVFKQLFLSNINRFISKDHQPNQAIWGKIYVEKTHVEIGILSDVFRREMGNAGFENPKQILKAWKASGLILTESGKNTKKRSIEKQTKNLILVKLNLADYEELLGVQTPSNFRRPKLAKVVDIDELEI